MLGIASGENGIGGGTLHPMVKRRSAIEPTIGHMKSDGRLTRNPRKGALGDAQHAAMCGCRAQRLDRTDQAGL